MEIRIRADSVEISGYVNAIERKSKPLWSRLGRFVERICKGAFKKALDRNDNVRILLNHDYNRDLGGTKDGNLELVEDNIGLHARATITDKEVIEKARNNQLVGWSFGFQDREVENKKDENNFPLRDVKDLDLIEVSILDNTKIPAYDGTLVAVRSDDECVMYGETFEDAIEVREMSEGNPEQNDESTPPTAVRDKNYEEYVKLLADMKK